MLNRKNLRTKRSMERLDHKLFALFVVKRKVRSRAYEIELPERWEINPVFHVSLFKPYPDDPVGKPEKIIPTPDIVDNEPSYVVAELVDSRWNGNPTLKFPQSFVQYIVPWKGYVPEENSWEPFKMLEGTAMEASHQFPKRYLSKPKDYRVIENPNRGTTRRR